MDNLRTKVKEAPLGSKERNLLKVILGDLQNLPGSGKAKVADPDDNTCIKYVESFMKTNRTTLEKLKGKQGMDKQIVEITDENICLSRLVPKQLTIDEIREHLKDVDVKSAPKTGPAIGMAMGHLKKQGLALNVKGNLVTQIVKEMRGE
jgi:uncharacterized protein YqeY